ncbi:MAG: C-GCAxxG-C-C family protein [Clostridioides sp.]|jgi:C_GCAxxG_C_C family probable redox protein|nr:C-GCAxxG-C-C family protein [Clostridioides sp.]
MIKASKFHEEGYNCAESIIKAYNEEYNKDIPVKIGTGLGGGCGIGSLCGAMNAANIIIGFEKGREDASEENIGKPYVQAAMIELNKKYESFLCSDIRIDKQHCDKIIDFAYENLIQTLNRDVLANNKEEK